ncbi:hypothetical protein JL721_12785 [Aureococcus anophagefferens]|nr:hypothetical protein JL721_12785 [Aureococcus anophagefferens]
MFQQMAVVMPPGVMPGQIMQVQTPAGIVQVQAPAGVPPGGQFVINVPAARAAAPVMRHDRGNAGAAQMRQTIAQQQYQAPPRSLPTPAQRPGGYAPPPPRQQYQPPPPVRQQPQYSGKLANTGSPVGRSLGAAPCNENCWKCVCGCYSPCCCLCLTQKVAQVRTGEVGVVESFGKYQRLAEPGENLLYAPLGSLTEDNVFVTIDVTILYKIPDVSKVRDAAYKLDNVPTQLQDSSVDDPDLVSKVKIDDAFLGKELRKAVLDEAAAKMLEFGYEIVDTLVTGIEPEPKKAIDIKRAEGRAEAKHLDGVGLARMRGAMIDGRRSRVGSTARRRRSSAATQLLLTTQYLDMLEALGRDDAGGTTKLFLPTAMTAVDDAVRLDAKAA